MNTGKLIKRRVWVLVKAYPQPSRKYEETVCCAGLDADSGELVRLYPIRYRQLPEAVQFNRFDLLEIEAEKSSQDPRPESLKVSEQSIRILERGSKSSSESRFALWRNRVSASFAALKEANRADDVSLGIVKPDPESLRFKAIKLQDSSEAERNEAEEVFFGQAALLEDPLKKLPRPEYVFKISFQSGETKHDMTLHDWEPQATWFNYERQYGSDALKKMKQFYEEELGKFNPHFIMGTQKSRPRQFMIIGVLRTPQGADKQTALSF